MAIVRELITKLGFKVDKTGLEKYEKTIIGFKTKLSLAVSAITLAVKKTLDYFKGIADGVTRTGDLAKAAHLATSEFAALRKTAEGFQVQPEQFEDAIMRLVKILREAKSGYGELFEIARKSRGQLNLKQFVNTGDVKGALREIIDYVRSLKDINDQLNVLSDIFGEEKAFGFLRIVNEGSDAFFRAAEANKAYGDSIAAAESKSREFQKSLTNFYMEFERFELIFVEKVLPAITFLLQKFNEGILGITDTWNMFKNSGILKTLDFLGRAVGEKGLELLGFEPLSVVQKQVAQEEEDFQKRFAEYKTQNISHAPVSINNRIDVTVPPGTPEEQSKIMALEVQLAMEQFWQEKTREVINNNPQVE